MLDLLKQHWLCLLVGVAFGYSLHWCPLLGHSHVCPHAGVAGPCKAVCACDDCACVENCACLVGEACGCKG